MAGGLGQGYAMVQLLGKHPAHDRAETARDANGAVLAQAVT